MVNGRESTRRRAEQARRENTPEQIKARLSGGVPSRLESPTSIRGSTGRTGFTRAEFDNRVEFGFSGFDDQARREISEAFSKGDIEGVSTDTSEAVIEQISRDRARIDAQIAAQQAIVDRGFNDPNANSRTIRAAQRNLSALKESRGRLTSTLTTAQKQLKTRRAKTAAQEKKERRTEVIQRGKPSRTQTRELTTRTIQAAPVQEKKKLKPTKERISGRPTFGKRITERLQALSSGAFQKASQLQTAIVTSIKGTDTEQSTPRRTPQEKFLPTTVITQNLLAPVTKEERIKEAIKGETLFQRVTRTSAEKFVETAPAVEKALRPLATVSEKQDELTAKGINIAAREGGKAVGFVAGKVLEETNLQLDIAREKQKSKSPIIRTIGKGEEIFTRVFKGAADFAQREPEKVAKFVGGGAAISFGLRTLASQAVRSEAVLLAAESGVARLATKATLEGVPLIFAAREIATAEPGKRPEKTGEVFVEFTAFGTGFAAESKLARKFFPQSFRGLARLQDAGQIGRIPSKAQQEEIRQLQKSRDILFKEKFAIQPTEPIRPEDLPIQGTIAQKTTALRIIQEEKGIIFGRASIDPKITKDVDVAFQGGPTNVRRVALRFREEAGIDIRRADLPTGELGFTGGGLDIKSAGPVETFAFTARPQRRQTPFGEVLVTTREQEFAAKIAGALSGRRGTKDILNLRTEAKALASDIKLDITESRFISPVRKARGQEFISRVKKAASIAPEQPVPLVPKEPSVISRLGNRLKKAQRDVTIPEGAVIKEEPFPTIGRLERFVSKAKEKGSRTFEGIERKLTRKGKRKTSRKELREAEAFERNVQLEQTKEPKTFEGIERKLTRESKRPSEIFPRPRPSVRPLIRDDVLRIPLRPSEIVSLREPPEKPSKNGLIEPSKIDPIISEPTSRFDTPPSQFDITRISVPSQPPSRTPPSRSQISFFDQPPSLFRPPTGGGRFSGGGLSFPGISAPKTGKRAFRFSQTLIGLEFGAPSKRKGSAATVFTGLEPIR